MLIETVLRTLISMAEDGLIFFEITLMVVKIYLIKTFIQFLKKEIINKFKKIDNTY